MDPKGETMYVLGSPKSSRRRRHLRSLKPRHNGRLGRRRGAHVGPPVLENGREKNNFGFPPFVRFFSFRFTAASNLYFQKFSRTFSSHARLQIQFTANMILNATTGFSPWKLLHRRSSKFIFFLAVVLPGRVRLPPRDVERGHLLPPPDQRGLQKQSEERTCFCRFFPSW